MECSESKEKKQQYTFSKSQTRFYFAFFFVTENKESVIGSRRKRNNMVQRLDNETTQL